MDTTQLKEGIYNCDSIDEFKNTIWKHVEEHKDIWKKYINCLIEQSGLSDGEFAKKCGVSRQTIYKWKNGSVPKNRETYFKIGFAANYDIVAMNELLDKIARMPRLYAKNLNDSIVMFVLSSIELEHNYETYKRILDMISKRINDKIVRDIDMDTSKFADKLLNVKQLDEMLTFVEENYSVYPKRYKKLYEYIKSYIRLNMSNMEVVCSASDDGLGFKSDRNSLNLFAKSQNWSASLEKCISEINQSKWIPHRNKLISIALHLNMTIDQLNEMFYLSKMSDLYSKNPFEAAVMYIIVDAELNDIIECSGTTDLCEYAINIMRQIDADYFSALISELMPMEEENKE